MKTANQVCQNRLAVAKIYHHQRDRQKQHADDQHVLLHLQVLCLDGSIGQQCWKVLPTVA